MCTKQKHTAIRSKQGQTQVSKLGSTQGQCTDKSVKKASDKAIQTAMSKQEIKGRDPEMPKTWRHKQQQMQDQLQKWHSRSDQCKAQVCSIK